MSRRCARSAWLSGRSLRFFHNLSERMDCPVSASGYRPKGRGWVARSINGVAPFISKMAYMMPSGYPP